MAGEPGAGADFGAVPCASARKHRTNKARAESGSATREILVTGRLLTRRLTGYSVLGVVRAAGLSAHHLAQSEHGYRGPPPGGEVE
jgi:hypothetical protein